MKKLLVLAICGLFGLSLSAYEWEPYGPPGINAFKIHIFEKDYFCTLLTDSGFYLTEEFDSKTWEHFEFNATGAASYNTDSILLILNEGSYSDGIYVMDVNTHIYNVLTYCERPNFIVKVPEESHYFVGFEGGLYESFDGIDWSELSLFTGTKCLDMASSTDMIMLAVDIAFDNAFVSFDQGVSWEPIVDDNKFIEFATMGYYGMFNTMVGITRSWGGAAVYMSLMELNGKIYIIRPILQHWELITAMHRLLGGTREPIQI